MWFFPGEIGWLPLAYIDVTAGGMILQVVLGGAAGILVILRLTWHRIKSRLFLGKKGNLEEQPSESKSE